jgi:uncharacterized protein (TIGR04255 family)
VQFDPVTLPEDRLQYFERIHKDLLAGEKAIQIATDRLELASSAGQSFPRLRPKWEPLITSFLDLFGISEVHGVSLQYLNEIELQDLRSFRETVNVSFEMPEALKERIEFFRTEFTYRYDFGEIHVWLQPDWDDEAETYCIQLSLESRRPEKLPRQDLFDVIQKLHDGIRDVFRQILAEDYIRQLPQ